MNGLQKTKRTPFKIVWIINVWKSKKCINQKHENINVRACWTPLLWCLTSINLIVLTWFKSGVDPGFLVRGTNSPKGIFFAWPFLWFIFKNFEDISPFRGATDNTVLDFWWYCPQFQSQGGSLACFLTCVILRFTSAVTPADCIEVSMTAEPFWSTYLQTTTLCSSHGQLGVRAPNLHQCLWTGIPFDHSGSEWNFFLIIALGKLEMITGKPNGFM